LDAPARGLPPFASPSADATWIDAHGQKFGIGRPYLDRDPPHIAPIDGKEYADHRRVNVIRAGL